MTEKALLRSEQDMLRDLRALDDRLEPHREEVDRLYLMVKLVETTFEAMLNPSRARLDPNRWRPA